MAAMRLHGFQLLLAILLPLERLIICSSDHLISVAWPRIPDKTQLEFTSLHESRPFTLATRILNLQNLASVRDWGPPARLDLFHQIENNEIFTTQLRFIAHGCFDVNSPG